ETGLVTIPFFGQGFLVHCKPVKLLPCGRLEADRYQLVRAQGKGTVNVLFLRFGGLAVETPGRRLRTAPLALSLNLEDEAQAAALNAHASNIRRFSGLFVRANHGNKPFTALVIHFY